MEKPSQTELRSLLHAASVGDQMAVKSLYDRCSVPLYNILLRMLKIEALAQDALQDVFVKIWQRADQYDHTLAEPMTWMSRIARNQAIDLLRSQQVRIDLDLAGGDDVLEKLADEGSNEWKMAENAASLLHCLEKLEAKPRLCVVRAFCEGYSQEELCTQTDAPLGTVKSWIRRSLIALRKCLDGLDE